MRFEYLRFEHIGFSHQSGIEISDFNFSINPGEKHCLFCPSNRTRDALFDFISGEISSFSGGIYLNSSNILPSKASEDFPVVFIREQIELFPELSVAENILGSRNDVFVAGCLDELKMFGWTQNLLQHFEIFNIDVSAKLKTLSPIDQRIISIIKAVGNEATVVFIEDSLSLYNSAEIKKYLHFVDKVVADGTAAVLVTDRYNQFVTSSNHISIVRSGTVIFHSNTALLDHQKLLSLTKSRDIAPEVISKDRSGESPLFIIGDNNGICPIIELFSDEILGIYDPDWRIGGSIHTVISKMISNKDILPTDFGVLTEDDCTNGIFRNLTLYENISLNSGIVFDKLLSTYNMQMDYYTVNHILKKLNADDLIEKYSRSSGLPKMSASEQMTIVIARYLCAKAKAFIFINPYIGYNDSTIERFNDTLKKLRDDGYPSIILSKNDMQLRQLCSRIMNYS